MDARHPFRRFIAAMRVAKADAAHAGVGDASAGRDLPEYRARAGESGLPGHWTRTADLAAEVTLQLIRCRFALDAAILFSDIMTPVEGMGAEDRVQSRPGDRKAGKAHRRRTSRNCVAWYRNATCHS